MAEIFCKGEIGAASTYRKRFSCYPDRIMRLLQFSILYLAAILPGFAQTSANTTPGLPKDPREIFAVAAPFYDFNDAALKPWQLKATYQLFDEKGIATKQGTFEYLWASPQVNRQSWTRPSAMRADWHTAEGKHWNLATGKPLEFFESRLPSMLFSPLPGMSELDAAKVQLDRQIVNLGHVKIPCIMVVPLQMARGPMPPTRLGMFPTYCFDPQSPVLRFSYSFGTLTSEFNNIAKVQNRYLPFEVLLFNGKRKILSATVNTVSGLTPTDLALTPSTDASIANPDEMQISAGVAAGSLAKKQTPIYPQDAKEARISGTVVLQAKIGVDGKVRELHVILSPSASLAASAIEAVSHWEYRPSFLNGKPVEVETTVNVIYSLSP